MATCPVQWWNVCNRAATLEPRRRLTHNSRAGIPKRKRPNCQKKENSRNCVGVISARKGGGPRDPAAQEVKGVAAQLASTWLLRQLLGCEQELLELSLCSAPQLAVVTPSVACLLGGVSFKSAYGRFVSLISNEDAAEFITYHQTVSAARCYVLLGTSLRMLVWLGYDVLRILSVWELQSCRSLLARTLLSS